PIAVMDEPGKAGYIHALWYGVLADVEPGRFVRLSSGNSPAPGSVVISTAEDCADCRLLARALNYIVYSVPPYSETVATGPRTLPGTRANIASANPPVSLIAGQIVRFRLLISNISSAEWPHVADDACARAVALRGRRFAVLG